MIAFKHEFYCPFLDLRTKHLCLKFRIELDLRGTVNTDELRVVPHFINKTVAESRSLAESLGLEITLGDTDGVLLESPDDGVNVSG